MASFRLRDAEIRGDSPKLLLISFGDVQLSGGATPGNPLFLRHLAGKMSGDPRMPVLIPIARSITEVDPGPTISMRYFTATKREGALECPVVYLSDPSSHSKLIVCLAERGQRLNEDDNWGQRT